MTKTHPFQIEIYEAINSDCPADSRFVAHAFDKKNNLQVATAFRPDESCGDALSDFLTNEILHRRQPILSLSKIASPPSPPRVVTYCNVNPACLPARRYCTHVLGKASRLEGRTRLGADPTCGEPLAARLALEMAPKKVVARDPQETAARLAAFNAAKKTARLNALAASRPSAATPLPDGSAPP
jgi:hypothetical protein